MKTEIKKTKDTIIVRINGKINFETYLPLQNHLKQLKNDLKSTHKKIIFNLDQLEFVGSSGMTHFFHLLKEFNETTSIKPHYCHVKSEFKKIIQAFDEENLFQFYENEDCAKSSFDHHN